MKRYFIIFPFVLFFFFAAVTSAQTAGKIFAREEADKLFGPVIENLKMNRSEFKAIIEKTGNFVLLKLVKGAVTILGDGRKVLYPYGAAAPDEKEVFNLFSKSLVVELLTGSADDIVCFENRKEVFSVTCGKCTLELSLPCPPFCY